MADRNILYRIRAALSGDKVAVAEEIALSLDGVTEDNVQDYLNVVGSDIATLQNTAFNSGRSFIRFNDGFTIDRNNIATYDDKNIIYTAKNDKPTDSGTAPDVNLPNDVEIQASSETYPVVFEFTHLGGTTRSDTVNLVRLFLDGVLLATLRRDEVAVVTKESASDDYVIQSSVFNPEDTILPNGVFNLKTDTAIDNIDNIGSELSGITIVTGDAFVVTTGGTWSGYTVTNEAVLVALTDNPSLADTLTNNDWLVLNNERVNANNVVLLRNFVRDDIVFQASRNIKIDPSNVNTFNSMATGLPISRILGTNTTGFNRQLRFDNVPIQFTDLVGGSLEIVISIDTATASGFPIEPLSLEIHYSDDISFTFPLDSVELDAGTFRLSIDIPNDDYTAILNTNASLRFNYNFRGVSYLGSYTISTLLNTSIGTLYNGIKDIADREANNVATAVNQRIDQVIGDVNDESRSLEAISDRISPYKNITVSTPEVNTYYLDSTGSDSFPATIPTFNQVSAENPRFTGGDVAVFLALQPTSNYSFRNITQDTALSIDTSEATVDLGESLSFNGVSYFVYRITGLTSGDVYEIENTTQRQVVAWSDDINNLESDIERIDAELEHAVFDLPDAVVQVLEHEVTVTEEDNPVIVATDYNTGLGSTNTQTVFYETNPNTPSAGILNSKPINETTGDRARRKLVYIPAGTNYINQAYLTAFDNTSGTELIRYVDGVFNAKVFVPSVPAGTRVETIYPAPATLISGSGIWINIPALTFQNGVPIPEADEIFFTRNLPSTSTTLNIQYRGHANGNVFGASSTTLTGVGGSSDVSTSFVLDDGGEQATVEVLWRANQRDIRVSVTERVGSGLPTINDVEVILSFSESRVVPEVSATTRDVPLEFVSSQGQVFAIKPSSNGTLILVGGIREVDTGYAYTDLFDSDESGYLFVASETATFLDYEDFEPIPSTITSLENHTSLPQFGLFTTQYTHDTIVDLATQLTVRDNMGNTIPVGVANNLTNTQRTAMDSGNTQTGTIVYDTTDKTFFGLTESGWVSLSS